MQIAFGTLAMVLGDLVDATGADSMDSMALVATCSATRSPVRERVCRFCSGSVVVGRAFG